MPMITNPEWGRELRRLGLPSYNFPTMLLDELVIDSDVYRDRDLIINNSAQAGIFKDTVNILIWRWYHSQPPERKLITLRKWFLSYDITVENIRPLLVWMFGMPVNHVSFLP
jgi:hypothetical protein